MAGIAPVVAAHLMVVILQHVKSRVYGIVAMANVSQQAMYVMAQVNSVTQAGVLTVLMVQMKAQKIVVMQMKLIVLVVVMD